MKKSVKIGLIVGGVSLILGLAGLFWYLGMTNNNRLIAKIPKEASLVFKADLKSLAEKSEFKKWKELGIFNNSGSYESDEERFMKDLLDNPKKSGINFMQNAYGFMSKGEDYVGGIVFGIKDAKDFEETVKKMDEDFEVQKTDGIYSVEIDRGDVALVWDKNVALMYFRDDENIVERAKDAFAQDEDMSMLEDDTFMEFDSQDADMGVYGDMEAIQKMTLSSFASKENESAMKAMEKVKAFGVTVLFDDQQMLVDATYFPMEDATPEDITMMKEEGVSDDLLKLISPVQPKGFYAVNFNLEKFLGIYPQLNEAVMEMGFTIDDLKNALNGEFSMALIDVKNVQTVKQVADYSNWDYYSEVPMKWDTLNELKPIFKLNFGIKDRSGTDNIISKYVTKMNEIPKVPEEIDLYDFEDPYSNSYNRNLSLETFVPEPKVKKYQYNNLEVLEMDDIKLMYKYEGNYLSMSNDESAFNGSSFSWDDNFEEMLTTHPGSGYINLDYTKYPDIERENAREVQRMKDVLLMFKDAKFTSDGLNVHFEMNFTDSPDHILWRMMKVIDSQNSNSSAFN